MSAPHITVTSTGLNAAEWAGRCVESVARQTYREHRHVYVANDHDTLMATGENYGDTFTINAAGRFDARQSHGTVDWSVVRWGEMPRLAAVTSDGRPVLANLLPIWRALPDDEVIVWLDGDDWLATDRALEVVADWYGSKAREETGRETWLTYGQFIWSNGELGFAGPHDHARARGSAWKATHLKTFRAGLVKQIRDEDLRVPAGVTTGGSEVRTASDPYISLAIDQAVMLPMLEMAAERACLIPNVLYVYNDRHSYGASGNTEHQRLEAEECYRIRRMPPYQRLTERPW